MEQDYKIKVGITQGDINGVGYEVILKTLSDPRITEMCTPVVYGSSKVAAYHRKALDLPTINFNIITNAEQISDMKLNMINCIDEEVKVELSRPTAQAGEAAYRALESATNDLENGLIDVLVTAPINKHTIQSDKFEFPGHTEYLEKKLGKGKKSLMILLNDILRVALVTGHIPLSEVPSRITKSDIVQKLRIFNHCLKQDFGIVKPRIAVLSLNPHAGEDGLLGNEEKEIIIPALKEAEEMDILCFGPYAMEIGFKTDNFEQLSYIDKIAESNCRIWINTLWESLCGGHDDEKAVNDPDNSWGWVLKNKATIIQTDRPQELITYLKQKGLRKIDR